MSSMLSGNISLLAASSCSFGGIFIHRSLQGHQNYTLAYPLRLYVTRALEEYWKSENRREAIVHEKKKTNSNSRYSFRQRRLRSELVFAQGAPGSGPTPQPRQTQPTIPGQPSPGLPQAEPMPGQPGTIPERVERPSAGDKGMVVSGDDIKKAKEALKAKGLNPGPIDGTLDSKTQQALRDFQKANKLPVTGVLDAQTAEKLGVTNEIGVTKEKGSIPGRAPGGSSVPKDSPMPER